MILSLLPISYMHLSQTVVNNLKHYYNDQAKKYAQTRHKFWAEKWLLQETLEQYYTTYHKKKIRILEFWCGDGRFLREVVVPLLQKSIEKNTPLSIEYIGVDISEWLLAFAHTFVYELPQEYKQYFTATFICADILNYVTECKQENFDCIVGIASFQHIKNYTERLFLMQWFYKILKYDGILLLVNRSFSEWFIKKYRKAILWWLWKYIISFWKWEWNSLLLPWKTGKKKQKDEIFYRFYHIFLLREFRKLLLFSSFVLKKMGYIDKQWKLWDTIKTAKNTFFLAQKNVIK